VFGFISLCLRGVKPAKGGCGKRRLSEARLSEARLSEARLNESAARKTAPGARPQYPQQ
jgi:hypothetical protein